MSITRKKYFKDAEEYKYDEECEKVDNKIMW